MFDATFFAALGAGLVAAVNPCGFAMLPAYVSFFIGTGDRTPTSKTAAVARAIAVALAVSLGFVAVFGTFGLLVHVGGAQRTIQENIPYATIVIGLGLVALAVAMLFGFELSARLPKLNKGGQSRGVGSMFVYGVSYAIASLSCTIPTFLLVVVGSFTRKGLLDGVVVLLAYAGGMALVMVALTVALALAQSSFVSFLRTGMKYANRAAAVLMLVMGAYVAWYGVFELRVRNDPTSSDTFVDLVTGWSSDAQQFVSDLGAGRLSVILLVVVTALVGLGTAIGRRNRDDSGGSDDATMAPTSA